MTEHEEFMIIKDIYVKSYELFKKYNSAVLDDDSWQELIDEVGDIQNEFRQHDDGIRKLCREMMTAYLSYKESKERRRNGNV